MHLSGVKTMGNTFLYEAFGFVLHSEYPVAQLPSAVKDAVPDIYIRNADLSGYDLPEDHYRLDEQEVLISISQVGIFRIADGKNIEVHPAPECEISNLGVYIMGTCMGAVLHQRGFMPLHGSCVTDGEHSVLITGDSGAGKSTLAAEFLSKGWQLLTDDVCAVFAVEGTPRVQSSYPSQKLWQDSLAHYEHPDSDIHSLYFSEEREKFGVDVSRYFHNGTGPLSMIVRLIPTEGPCSITSIDGVARLDQLLQNTYRSFMVPPGQRQRHFQRCATLGEKIPMVLLTRQEGEQCAEQLFDLILEYMK